MKLHLEAGSRQKGSQNVDQYFTWSRLLLGFGKWMFLWGSLLEPRLHREHRMPTPAQWAALQGGSQMFTS